MIICITSFLGFIALVVPLLLSLDYRDTVSFNSPCFSSQPLDPHNARIAATSAHSMKIYAD